MFSGLFDASRVPDVVLRTALVYAALVLALRLAGKREVGQMKPFDLVALLILSNAVQNAMVGPDTSLVGGLAAAAVILLLNYAVSRLRERFAVAEGVFAGSPSLIVSDGRLIPEHLHAEHVAEADVLQAMREHGIDSLAEVKAAVLEVDGTISIIPTDKATVIRTKRRVRRQRM